MKLMDEVKLESSIEALEALEVAYRSPLYKAEFKQNVKALREVLTEALAMPTPALPEKSVELTDEEIAKIAEDIREACQYGASTSDVVEMIRQCLTPGTVQTPQAPIK